MLFAWIYPLVSERVQYCIATTVFRYWNGIVPTYINDMFKPSYNRHNTRSQLELDVPVRKTNTGQQVSSFRGHRKYELK